MRTCRSGKVFLKSESVTDASNRLKKEACAPTPTLSAVSAFAHACAPLVVVVPMVKSTEASRFRNTVVEAAPPSADSPTSTCGMRWPVASSVTPMSGLVEMDTSADDEVSVGQSVVWMVDFG